MPRVPSMGVLRERLRSWPRQLSCLPWRRDVAVLTAALLLILPWAYSRIVVFEVYQGRTNPIVPSAYYAYHGMAVALESGHVGQLDLLRYRAHRSMGDPRAEYPPADAGGRTEFVDYYSLDAGYAVIVEVARFLFPTFPDSFLRVLGLQLLVDCAMIAFVFFVSSRWGLGVGAATTLAYVCNAVFARLVAIPLYYYWDVPIGLALLGAVLVALETPRRAGVLLGAAGALLGFAVWVRASWWPLAVVYFGLVASSRVLRSRLLPAVVIFAVVAAPQVWRSSHARGHLALSTRATWHVAMTGLGYYPNPYGLEPSDESVFRLTQERHGVAFLMQDYGPHDEAAKLEYLAILRRDPRFVWTSFFGRLWESVTGTTSDSASAYPGLPNPLHRGLCLLGFVVMHLKGGARRLVAWIAGSWFVTYVALTSLFYIVALAYDNVSQVCLLILFMGLLEAVVRGPRARGERPERQDT